ncbi:hypothetical protein [Streptomyces globisporus]|uniref:hypothetical protein n=1 Tax=Streptomyces globisporus TaxID=1908 RepID=UPI00346090F1|nr:hypothetical protein OG425_25560 [Streptomyces globisporus]
MDEWKYTLLNGAISTGGALLVGMFALYGVLRQAAKAQDSAAKQNLALLEQVDRSATATRDQAKWQLRRDSYAGMLNSCDQYESVVDRLGWFLSDQFDESGEVVADFDDSTYAEELSASLSRVRTQTHTLRLEGPKALDPQMREYLKEAGEMYEVLHSWSSLLHEGRYSDYVDDWKWQQADLIEARENLFQAMYAVLHE